MGDTERNGAAADDVRGREKCWLSLPALDFDDDPLSAEPGVDPEAQHQHEEDAVKLSPTTLGASWRGSSIAVARAWPSSST